MKPKEKAEELFQKFIKFTPADEELEFEYTKQCALIAVDEILKALESERINYASSYRFEESEYWEQVKQEIEKL